MNETLKVLEPRRSCRNFKIDMFGEEERKAILMEGTAAAEPAKEPAPRKEDYIFCI